METTNVKPSMDREAIVRRLIKRLGEMMVDWDKAADAVTEQSLLVQELGFSSMDLVMLVVDIQQTYGRRDLPFERLFAPQGKYVEDVRVAEIADFLHQHLLAAC